MKTWEMIKELTENPNKKFYVVGSKHLIARVEFQTNKIEVVNASMKPTHVEVNPSVDWDWEEVKEPVSFMEAMKIVRKTGKKINAEHHLIPRRRTGYMYLDVLLDFLGRKFSDITLATILLDAKFYIED